MARKKNTETLLTVAGGIAPVTREALEAHRWATRQGVSDIVRKAVDLYVAQEITPEALAAAEKAVADGTSEFAPKEPAKA